MRSLHQVILATTIGMLLNTFAPLNVYSQNSGGTNRTSRARVDFSDAASNKPLTPRQIVEKVLPSVVLIVAQG